MRQLGNFFSKNLITVLIIGAVVFLVWKFRDSFSLFKELRKKMSVNPLLTSKSSDQLENIAEIQFIAMSNIGTDTELLFESLKGLNKHDLKSVYNRFGLRDYALFGATQQPIIGSSINLFEWYQNELGKADLKKMKEIWSQTGLIF